MFTQARIAELRQRTGVSTVEAMHALANADGDMERAIADLQDHARSGIRAIVAATKDSAQRIAAALIDAGIWFECELTAEAQWRFSVALGAYTKLLALTSTTQGEVAGNSAAA
jgi:hypothetical protein